MSRMDKKEKVLILVESPTKIATIKKYLVDPERYTIIATYGHIADLSNYGDFNTGVDIDNGFRLHYTVNPDKKERLAAIIGAASLCDKILMATDPDREGEAIASLVADRIKTCGKPIKRIEFGEITKEGVIAGIKNERNIDNNLVNAAKARRALDRIVGYMGSPFIIKALGKNMSAGRVQSVALKLAVDREREIIEFKPEEYWIIKANLAKFAKDPFVATYYSKKDITTKEEADELKKQLDESSFKVSKIVAKPRKRNPPAPLNTAKLQISVANRYKIAPTKIMEVAQNLYESGMITYMRTDSVRLSNEAINMAREWLKQNYPAALPESPNIYKNKDSAQNAHEAIRPTNINVLPEKAPKTEAEKVYKTIWDVFVASQMTPAIYDTTSVTIVTEKKHELRANGRMLRDPGWLVIASNIEEDDGEKDTRLPLLVVDDVLSLVEPRIVTEQKFTQPPPRYKYQSIIKELEEKGIGRPSTYATIMDKLVNVRGFLVKEADSTLHPSESGMNVVELLEKNFSFMQYNFTADMEEKLDKIEHGTYSYSQAMGEFYEVFSKELDKAYKNSTKSVICACDKCGAHMIIKKGPNGTFLGCSRYPKCKYSMSCSVTADGKIKANDAPEPAPYDVKCPTCDGKMCIVKYGTYESYRCAKYPACQGRKRIPCGKKCPTCNDDMSIIFFKNPPNIGFHYCCMSYPKCNYFVKKED